MARRPGTEPRRPPAPLPVRIVGRTAGALGLLGLVAFVVIVVLLIVRGAGNGNGNGNGNDSVLSAMVPVLAGLVVLSLLLALLNSIGVRPWFDPVTGAFARPRSAAGWAIALGGLVAGTLIPVTLITLVVVASVLFSSRDAPNAVSDVLSGIVIGGVGTAITSAAIAGGIAIMGWFGVVAGLMLGAGFVGVVIASTGGSPVAWVLGIVALGLAVASYVTGGRLHGTIPSSAGWLAASGGYLVLGIAYFLLASITHDPIPVVGGVAGVAATIGWIIGGIRARDRSGTPPRA